MPFPNRVRHRDRSALRVTARPGSIGTSLGQQPVLIPAALPLIPRLVRAIGRTFGGQRMRGQRPGL